MKMEWIPWNSITKVDNKYVITSTDYVSSEDYVSNPWYHHIFGYESIFTEVGDEVIGAYTQRPGCFQPSLQLQWLGQGVACLPTPMMSNYDHYSTDSPFHTTEKPAEPWIIFPKDCVVCAWQDWEKYASM